MENKALSQSHRYDWHPKRARNSQILSLPTANLGKVSHKGTVTRESQIKPIGEVISWLDSATPEPLELMKRLQLRVHWKDLSVLESFKKIIQVEDPVTGELKDQEILLIDTSKEYVSGVELLKAIGLTSRSMSYDSYPTAIAVCPKYLLACLVFNHRIGVLNHKHLRSIADRMDWRSDQSIPTKVRIGVDVFRCELSGRHPQPSEVQTIARERAKKAPKRQPNRLFKHGGKPVEELATKDLARIKILDAPFFENVGVKLFLVPSHNRGKHVCTIRILNTRNGAYQDIGTIRAMTHKGKVCLFFSSPILTHKPDQLNQEIRKAAIDRDAATAKIKALKVDLKAARLKVQHLKRSVTSVAQLGVIEAINAIESHCADLQKQIDDLRVAAMPPSDCDIQALPESVAVPTLDILRSLGLNPNHWIRAIPKQSPLINSEFWMDWFSIEVSIQNNQPIELISDRRTQRQKSDRRNHKR
jgi:hypothetical protein